MRCASALWTITSMGVALGLSVSGGAALQSNAIHACILKQTGLVRIAKRCKSGERASKRALFSGRNRKPV
jgi:hypothetical protein